MGLATRASTATSPLVGKACVDVPLHSNLTDVPSEGSISRRGLAIEAARKAFATGHVREAAWICDALLRGDGRDAEVAMLRFDLHASSEEYVQAYNLIGAFVRPGADTDLLLRAAFAAAFTGRPRPEMKEFCDAYLPWTTLSRPSHTLHGRSLKALRLSASLALAADARMSRQDHVALMYIERAQEEDPSNPNAAWLLEGICSERRQYVQALDALCKGRVRMAPAEGRDADVRIRELHRVVNAQRSEPAASGYGLRGRLQVV
ncbi:MAG: hypothetical protein ACO1SV_17230 [Fimbriimonas sp.]